MSRGARKRVKEAVWKLEELGAVSELMKLLKAKRTVSAAVSAEQPATGN